MPHSPVDTVVPSVTANTLLLATDHKHSIIAEVAGGKPGSIAYCAYGHSARQNISTSLGFTGERREMRLGWYLLGNGYRAYNPTLMRFHSPDSWSPFGGGGLNAYMFCAGDPVNFSDPTGHALFPGIPKAITRPVQNVVDFFFGGSSITGPKRLSSSDQALKRLGGLQGTESDGVDSAMAGAGMLMAGAPYPFRGTPRISSYNYGVPSTNGYVDGAALGGLTALGNRVTRSASRNPNLAMPPSVVRHQVGRDTITTTYSNGRTVTRPREAVRGGGDRAVPNVYSPTPVRPVPAPTPSGPRHVMRGQNISINISPETARHAMRAPAPQPRSWTPQEVIRSVLDNRYPPV